MTGPQTDRAALRNSDPLRSFNGRESREEAMDNVFDVDLDDPEQFGEIQLLGELMVLASESMGALDLRTIDATLGVDATPLPGQRRSG